MKASGRISDILGSPPKAYYMDDCPADTLEEFQEELDLVKQSLTEAAAAVLRQDFI